MPKIVVTGGNGYIGSHTAVTLLQQGFEVVVIDNLCNSKPYVADRIREITGKPCTFYQIDICDRDALEEILSKEAPFDGVIHFAAHLFVDESVQNPLKYYDNNLMGLLSLLNATKGVSRKNTVFSSSCTVYGNPDQLPISETESIKAAVSPYGNTKRISEEILHDATKADESLNVVALRYFNPIGAHNSGKIGEDPIGHHTHLVPIVSEVAARKREFLKVFGNDYNTIDGTCVRDYIHVQDLANAHIKALGYLIEGKNSEQFEAFNAGSGSGYTVLEIVKAFEKASGIEVPYQIAPRRAGDAEAIYADIALIKEKLDWEPKHSLDQMLLSAYNWEKSIETV